MSEQVPSRYSPEEVAVMLAAVTDVTPEELRESRYVSVVGIELLTPDEIFSAVHAVQDASHRIQQAHMIQRGHPGEPVEITAADRQLAEYRHNIDSAIDALPLLAGVEKTRDVFTLLAGSESPADRAYAANYMGVLTLVDHDYGIELWKRLLEDDNLRVAHGAWFAITDSGFDTNAPQRAMETIAKDGLTWTDWIGMIETYVRKLEALRHQSIDPDDPAH